jgi:hypothetical protein
MHQPMKQLGPRGASIAVQNHHLLRVLPKLLHSAFQFLNVAEPQDNQRQQRQDVEQAELRRIVA